MAKNVSKMKDVLNWIKCKFALIAMGFLKEVGSDC